MDQSISAYNITTKFNADGTVRFFPGNTVVSMITQDIPVYPAFRRIRAMLEAKEAARCVTMLPDDSLHMTVLEGVCHQWRRPELWTDRLPLDCRLTEVDDLFERVFHEAEPLGKVEMELDGINQSRGISVRVRPVTEEDDRKIRRYRDALADAMGVRFPNHDAYRFHISMCYFTKDPTEAEWEEIHAFKAEAEAYIGACKTRFVMREPLLTFFDNMFYFHPRRIDRSGL